MCGCDVYTTVFFYNKLLTLQQNHYLCCKSEIRMNQYMRNFFKIASFLGVILLLNACDSLGLDESAKTRTVLVYIAANNNLSSYSAYNFNQMCTGMSSVDTRKNNLLIYLHNTDGAWLIRLNRKSNETVSIDTLKTYSASQVSTNSDVMLQVMKDAFGAYPADKYGLVLWSHGDGWVQSTTSGEEASASTTKAVTRWFGSENGYQMDVTTLKNVLSSSGIPHFQFILFDACYMQTVEVDYELKSATDYIIASPLEITADGGPYHRVVPFMFADVSDEEEYVKNIAKVYYAYYHTDEDSNWSTGVCLSVVNCNQLDNLASATSSAFSGRTDQIDTLQTNLKSGVSNLQYFDPIYSFHSYYDMGDAMSRIASTEAYSTWSTQLSKTIVWNGTEPASTSAYLPYSTLTINKDCGVSMYVPLAINRITTSWNTFYKTLDWYTAANMSVFM